MQLDLSCISAASGQYLQVHKVRLLPFCGPQTGNRDAAQVDMETARNKELQFFKANPRYADLKNIGMNFLSNKLSNHLIGAIRRQLPAIQNQINTGQFWWLA